VVKHERILTELRDRLARSDEERKSLEGEVAILRNQLSAFATELSSKRIEVQNINKSLEERMQRLDAAKKKYNATKDRLQREKDTQDHLESGNTMSVSEHKEADTMMGEVENQIRSQKDTLFKESQKLYKLRAEQADLIGAISGTLSASKNL
jgi:chromosome segregation ATPase